MVDRLQVELASAALADLSRAAGGVLGGECVDADPALEQRVRSAVLDCTRRSDLNPHAWSMTAVALERVRLAPLLAAYQWVCVVRALLPLVDRDLAVLRGEILPELP